MTGEYMKKVPTLNLSEYRSNDQSLKDKFIKDLYNSFEEYGFVVIKGHDIPRNLAERVFSSMEKFFSLPVEVKTSMIWKMVAKEVTLSLE